MDRATEMQDDEHAAIIHRNWGATLQEQGEFRDALIHHRANLSIAQRRKDKVAEAIAWADCGSTLMNMARKLMPHADVLMTQEERAQLTKRPRADEVSY